MFEGVKRAFRQFVPTKNDRELAAMQPMVARVNDLEPWAQNFDREGMRRQMREWREQTESIDDDKKRLARLDELMPHVFALTREVARRTVEMRHYDVQLIGGAVLHQGKVAEMKTGEGKTVVATLPLVLNSLEGRGGHLVTVNDYLAKRDAEWMGKIYRYLGLTTGNVVHGMTTSDRRRAYESDITYGQNNEFGFDYLRDNMKFSLTEYVQRELHYAIVDEVDSILIDESRTPLIISGPGEESTDKYHTINQITPSLKRERDFSVDEKSKTAVLTEEGVTKVERLLGVDNLYDPRHIETLHHVNQALRAHAMYRNEVDYVVQNGEVIIVDEFTGRLMPGRRWSDGLHQAVEAKEGVEIQNENQTLATISFQNYFRLYRKLAGMTGTAETEKREFQETYNLPVRVIPTNEPNRREDFEDVIFRSEREKFNAVMDEIESYHHEGKPVLVGTISIEKSEILGRMLSMRKIPHNVLNAKHHQKEAQIVAQAGRKGAVTIATNMAGRGTDILLGGNPEARALSKVGPEPMPNDDPDIPEEERETEEQFQQRLDEWRARFDEAVSHFKKQCDIEHDEVVEPKTVTYTVAGKEYTETIPGGIHILGTERHESRRIDNQLRGRSGRQGDPGTSRFYLSLEDDLMRIFAPERISGLMERLGMKDGEPIEHHWVSKAVENAQNKVEGHHFEMRKHLLEYDNVMSQQRKTVYDLRRRVLMGEVLNGVLRAADPDTGLVSRELAEQIMRYADLERRERLMAAFDERDQVPRDELAKLIDEQGWSSREMMLDMIEDLVIAETETHCSVAARPEDWNLDALAESIERTFGIDLDMSEVDRNAEAIQEHVYFALEAAYNEREERNGAEAQRYLERVLHLEQIDSGWREHLQAMDHLREGISLRGYAQKDPKREYQREGYDMFVAMLDRVKANAVSKLFRVQLQSEEQVQEMEARQRQRRTPTQLVHGAAAGPQSQQAAQAKRIERLQRRGVQRGFKPTETIVRDAPKLGRNDPCHCGSGKKYKNCCYRRDMEAMTG